MTPCSPLFQGSLVDTLKEVRPTRFIGVPRVYEKIHEKMLEISSQNGRFKKVIAEWAKKQGTAHHMQKMQGGNKSSLQYKFAKYFIFSQVF